MLTHVRECVERGEGGLSVRLQGEVSKSGHCAHTRERVCRERGGGPFSQTAGGGV